MRRGRLWSARNTGAGHARAAPGFKRGPLERGRALATLVVHTAGTRQSAVTVPHLDADDADACATICRGRSTTMTTPDVAESTAPTAAATRRRAERRLHPMSWLFVLVQQLKQFIVPLLALLVFGRGDRNELWPLIGVGVLAVVSLWQYFTYRYGVVGDAWWSAAGCWNAACA